MGGDRMTRQERGRLGGGNITSIELKKNGAMYSMDITTLSHRKKTEVGRCGTGREWNGKVGAGAGTVMGPGGARASAGEASRAAWPPDRRRTPCGGDKNRGVPCGRRVRALGRRVSTAGAG